MAVLQSVDYWRIAASLHRHYCGRRIVNCSVIPTPNVGRARRSYRHVFWPQYSNEIIVGWRKITTTQSCRNRNVSYGYGIMQQCSSGDVYGRVCVLIGGKWPGGCSSWPKPNNSHIILYTQCYVWLQLRLMGCTKWDSIIGDQRLCPHRTALQ